MILPTLTTNASFVTPSRIQATAHCHQNRPMQRKNQLKHSRVASQRPRITSSQVASRTKWLIFRRAKIKMKSRKIFVFSVHFRLTSAITTTTVRSVISMPATARSEHSTVSNRNLLRWVPTRESKGRMSLSVCWFVGQSLGWMHDDDNCNWTAAASTYPSVYSFPIPYGSDVQLQSLANNCGSLQNRAAG